MSELKKYQRSKQLIMEMIDRIKHNNPFGAFKSEDAQYTKISKDLEELHKLVEVIDCRLAKLQQPRSHKDAA